MIYAFCVFLLIISILSGFKQSLDGQSKTVNVLVVKMPIMYGSRQKNLPVMASSHIGATGQDAQYHLGPWFCERLAIVVIFMMS